MLAALLLAASASTQRATIETSTFLESLSAGQRTAVMFPFESPERFDWAFVPKERKGVPLRDLTPEQRTKLTQVLRQVLSEDGMKMIDNVRILEGVLRDAEGPHRDPDYYVTTIFGTPSQSDPWALRYEGHHLSLNFTFQGTKLTSTTPQFLGANPATVLSGPHKGLKILAKQEDGAFDLLHALDPAQLAMAITSSDAPADIVTGNKRTAAIQSDSGIPYTKLTPAQQKQLRTLVESHAQVQKSKRAADIKKEGWDHVVFAWMGSTEPGKAHYYRIQSRSYLIEFDNTQNNANHIHAVWRSFKGDFGDDALAEHYALHRHTR